MVVQKLVIIKMAKGNDPDYVSVDSISCNEHFIQILFYLYL